MENIIKILYDGKEFRNFQKSKVSDMDKLLIQGMASDIEAVLTGYVPEIEREGGEVLINVRGPSMFEISTDGLSDKLKKRILEALKPAD
jgi:hypothetical protein